MTSEPPEYPRAEGTAEALESGAGPRRIFYGWWIVGASTMASAIQSAIFNVGAAALFLPIAREFGTTRTVVAGAFSASRLEGGLTGPIEGYLIHWVGPRQYMLVGWVLFGLGLIGVGLARSIVEFYAAFLVVTLGQSMAGFLPIVTILVNWFRRWRGRAIGMYQVGSSIGAVMVPGVAWLILNVGWRETTMGAGVIAILMGIPLVAVMRPRPESYGYLPDGASPEPATIEGAATGKEQPDERSYPDEPTQTVAQALRSRNFWFLGAAHSIALTSWGALRVHEIPALVDMGLTEQAAANILSLSFAVAAIGRLAGGFLGDLIGAKRVLVIALLLQGMAVVILAYATTLAQVLVFAIIFGLGFGARGTLMTVLRGDVFGRRNFSRLAGLMDPLSTVGVVLAPLLAAFAYDILGSYRIAFLITAALTVAGVFLLMGVRLPKRTNN